MPVRPRPRPSRLVAEGSRIALGSWAEGEFSIVSAALLGLNRDGIMAIADGAFRSGQRVWIRVDRARTVQTALATVLNANWLRGGGCALRLALDDDYPAGIYEALVSGLSRRGPA